MEQQNWKRINTTKEQESKPLHILVTGAAGQIGYNVLFLIAHGLMFGHHQTVILHLYDIMTEAMEGIKMELLDCCFPLLKGIVASNKVEVAFKDVEVAILIAGMPRKEGMERKELIGINTRIIREQSLALKNYSSRDVRVLVVANPANTNALVVATHANINIKQISCLTRLDQNRARAQIAEKLKCSVDNVSNVFVWGNHSEKQCPDLTNAIVKIDSEYKKVTELIDDEWLKSFNKIVQERGAKVIEKRKASSSGSAAKAIVDHCRDWCLGTKENQIISMGVYSNGEYGIAPGIFFSFPVICKNGEYHIVTDFTLTDDVQEMIIHSEEELLEEKRLQSAFEELTCSSTIQD